MNVAEKHWASLEAFSPLDVIAGVAGGDLTMFPVLKAMMRAACQCADKKGPICLICPAELTPDSIKDGMIITFRHLGVDAKSNGNLMIVCGDCVAKTDWWATITHNARNKWFDDPGLEVIVPPPDPGGIH